MAMGLHLVVVGLGFGRAFVPLYLRHPEVGRVSVCDTNSVALSKVNQEFGLDEGYGSLEEVLSDSSVDAVHLLTPLPIHASQSVAVLRAGKHCACAVTMGLTLEEISEVVRAARETGKRYMMMETGAYSKELFLAKDLYDRGEMGQVNFASGEYYQDLEAPYAEYWKETPPMKYSSHCLGPILTILQTQAVSVSCIGVGRIRPDICTNPLNPFPMQIAHFRLADSDAVVQINRAWYQVAHSFKESFSIFGEKKGFEWSQLDEEDPVIHTLGPAQTDIRWRPIESKRTPTPYRPDLLPEPLRDLGDGGHGGSHPHLVHEFVSSIVEERPAAIHENVAFNWTAAGICAHESSMRNGDWVEIPRG